MFAFRYLFIAHSKKVVLSFTAGTIFCISVYVTTSIAHLLIFEYSVKSTSDADPIHLIQILFCFDFDKIGFYFVFVLSGYWLFSVVLQPIHSSIK
ncbi:hypothetical protein L596_020848 [Steinernema carpocapsae]|uniref:Uncharacterized protein n=1 Tax=Steinernema carpocapsae TaxID=34508 RepID=A0A4U5MUT6_STECR|nr:hypothetical protein L596_020848 [Steinernema carpocapsae]